MRLFLSVNRVTMLWPFLASVWATLPFGLWTREVVRRSYIFTYSFERRLHDNRSEGTLWHVCILGVKCVSETYGLACFYAAHQKLMFYRPVSMNLSHWYIVIYIALSGNWFSYIYIPLMWRLSLNTGAWCEGYTTQYHHDVLETYILKGFS